jgi:TRAP-type mannitol/chloroaromatic compound transport system permease small subunit
VTGAAHRLAERLDRVNAAVGHVVCWAGLVMVLAQFAVVLARYVFGVSDVAATESVLYLHATLFMLGAGYTLLVDGHVRVDILYARAGSRTRAAIDALGHAVLLIPSVAVLLWWSWPSVRNAWAIREGAISVGGIPASFLLKTLIPAFCMLVLIQSAACLLRALATLRGEPRP